jgi:hypothetical protein
LEHVIPFSIQQRLSENPEKCCGSIVSNAAKRCSKNAKGSPRTTLAALSSLAKAANKGKYAEVLSVTESVIKSAMCAHHIKSSTSTDRFGRLESAVEYLTNETGSSSSINIDEIHSWIEAISAITIQATESPIHVKAEATVKTEVASHVHDRTTGTTSKPQHKATFLPPLATLYPFQPFQSKRLQKMTVTDALKKLASRPLGEADLKPGFIYIFWYKPRFGHVKIGRSGNPERRIQEWNKQCKREHEFHKLSNALVEVPHVNRIENLMHVEMKELRRQMRCEGCGTNHREWFQVTEDHAVNVFEKWKDWILESPYKRDKNTGDWTLGSSSAKTLDEICEPVKLEKPERKQAPRKPRQKAQRKSVGSRPQLKRQLHLDDFLEVKPGEPLVKPQNEAPKAVPLSTKD